MRCVHAADVWRVLREIPGKVIREESISPAWINAHKLAAPLRTEVKQLSKRTVELEMQLLIKVLPRLAAGKRGKRALRLALKLKAVALCCVGRRAAKLPVTGLFGGGT
ncbi:MAG TPA: hypothetical protein PKM88_03485 [bacterium]|mgnify:CR=1 FL=1|nr:hypothetical protein [bacterium]